MRVPFARRRTPATFPVPAPAPLHTPGNGAAAMPLGAALAVAREALDRHQDADTHSRPAMRFAAIDLHHALRLLVAAHDHPQDH
ncbi:hypothetical protein [Streptomyces omiyaensis]|uniref:hypothetical protein n=1 Tax=Streptomyces omiyaensis TaxID=68247 RepID=UPI0036FDD398